MWIGVRGGASSILDDEFLDGPRRYENRSTIMTSNRPQEEWGKLIGDVPAATAILDRFLHHAEIIEITGRSYRLKDRARAKETRTCTKAENSVQ
jgi:hypothetical protein